METIIAVSAIRQVAEHAVPPSPEEPCDYRIAARLGQAFLAKNKQGSLALLVPLASDGGSVGRSGGGFTLRAAHEVAFDHNDRIWNQSAAVLECTDDRVSTTFLALVADLANCLSITAGEATWHQILLWMEEWQLLLGRRKILSPEAQLGLWGELLVMSFAPAADVLFAAWRGPEEDTVDFFHDGRGLEVKASKHRCVHHVSQTQVPKPRGEFPSHFLSLWVSVEPVRGVSLAEIIDRLVDRLPDPGAFLKYVSRTGYSLDDREEYMTRFLLLEPPRWFNAEDVPRIRAADSGVSQIRYVVALDTDLSLDESQAQFLCRHFFGVDRQPTDIKAIFE